MRAAHLLLVAPGLLALGSPMSPIQQRAAGAWPVRFEDVADRAGLRVPSVYGGVDRKRFIIETNGAGAAWIDLDRDGWIDAVVLGGTRLAPAARHEDPAVARAGPTSRAYRNRGDGTFEDVTAASGLGRTVWASSICAGDYDNDGAIDLYATAYGTNVLYRNDGRGRFADRSAEAGLPVTGTRWGSGCSFLDYDRDGDLDLFVANYLAFDLAAAHEPGEGVNCLWKGIPVNCGPKGLPTDTNLLYRNDGGRFADVSEASGVARVRNRYPMSVVAADLDEDGWVDLYVASDSTAAIHYRNRGDGTFADEALLRGTAFSENGMPQAGMGAAAGDVDADGRLDLVKTHFADDIPALYRAVGGGRFEEIAMAAGLGSRNRHVEWGAGLADFDNDGWQDLLYVTGNVYPEVEARLRDYPHRSPLAVFRNLGAGRFQDVTAESGPGAATPRSSRGAAFGDYDNDGDVDVLVMNMNEPPSLLRNGYAGPNHWLQILLEGTASNRAAIGATVRVTAGGRTQARAVLSQSSYYSHDDLRLSFGLGHATSADRVEVRWPGGRTEVVTAVPANRRIHIREERGIVGSVP